jgi:peroxiredoxin
MYSNPYFSRPNSAASWELPLLRLLWCALEIMLDIGTALKGSTLSAGALPAVPSAAQQQKAQIHSCQPAKNTTICHQPVKIRRLRTAAMEAEREALHLLQQFLCIKMRLKPFERAGLL